MSKRPHSSTLLQSHNHSDTTSRPSKRRKTGTIHHRIRHSQPRPAHIELAPQHPVFIQGQLLKSITAALTLAGFDGASEGALEMFRGGVEEFILDFLHTARSSMRNSRRTTPTPLDFATALSVSSPTSTATDLLPQVNLSLPSQISNPEIEPPTTPPLSPPRSFTHLLNSPTTMDKVTERIRRYVPSHFPALPPQHAWKSTPVFPERESDQRRLRERGVEEGVLAERALRRLASASRSRDLEIVAKKGEGGNGLRGERKLASRGHGRREVDGAAMFAEMLRDVGQSGRNANDESGNSLRTTEEGLEFGGQEGVVVNWDTGGWRRGGGQSVRVQ